MFDSQSRSRAGIDRNLRLGLPIASRIIASLVGGWVFVWGFATLGITALVALGMPYEEARTLAMLLSFIVFLIAFCWAFAVASVARLWVVLAGGGAAMTAAAWWLMRSLA